MSETFADIRPVQVFSREDVNERRFARLNGQHGSRTDRTELEMAQTGLSDA